jgi:hypothetical protein
MESMGRLWNQSWELAVLAMPRRYLHGNFGSFFQVLLTEEKCIGAERPEGYRMGGAKRYPSVAVYQG